VKKGYNGSVVSKIYKEIWDSERKNNPFFFKTNIIKTFLNIKEAQDHELKLQRHFKVQMNPMYINRSIGGRCNNIGYINITNELVLKKIPKHLPIPEGWRRGVPQYIIDNMKNATRTIPFFSEEERRRRSIARLGMTSTMKNKTWEEIYGYEKAKIRREYYNTSFKGVNSNNYGKTPSDKSKEKNRIAHLGLVVVKNIDGDVFRVTKEEFDKRNDLSGNCKNLICITNGILDMKVKPNQSIPNGWYKGSRNKNNFIHIHNYIISKQLSKEKEIPKGWYKGRITKNIIKDIKDLIGHVYDY
jgi:hypothetical protein